MLFVVWKLLVLAGLVSLTLLYLRGASERTLTQSDTLPPFKRWQIVTFASGLCLIAVILVTPLADLGRRYFSARVVQHILLTGLTPLLLFVSDPYHTLRLGLPPAFRAKGQVFLTQRPRLKQTIVQVTSPGVIWMAFVVIFWLCYDPWIIASSQSHAWVYALEMSALSAVSALYWWHIAAAEPRLHPTIPPIFRIFYVFAGMVPIKLLGIFLLFGSEAFIGVYVSQTADTDLISLGSMTISDQSLGAILIWVMGGAIYTYSATFLAGRWIELEEAREPMPFSILEDEEVWRAPHLEKRS